MKRSNVENRVIGLRVSVDYCAKRNTLCERFSVDRTNRRKDPIKYIRNLKYVIKMLVSVMAHNLTGRE